MKKLKKVLACVSSALIVSFTMLINVSALYIEGFIEIDGKYYTQEELWEDYVNTAQIKLELNSEYIMPETKREENKPTYNVLDTNSDLYKFLESYKFDDKYFFWDYDNVNEYVICLKMNGTPIEELCSMLETYPEVASATPDVYFIFLASNEEAQLIDPLSGDLSMDGKVNIVDAVKLAKYNSDPTAYPLLTYSQLAADVNGDGELTNADLIALVKMI